MEVRDGKTDKLAYGHRWGIENYIIIILADDLLTCKSRIEQNELWLLFIISLDLPRPPRGLREARTNVIDRPGIIRLHL